MMRGMFSAVSGLKTQQVMLDVAANDLANVNTVGYKAARTTFKDQLQQLVRTSSASGAGFGGANAAQIGLGVGLGTIDNLMSGGAVQATGNALDLAIQGDGWFRTGPGTPTPGTPAAGTPAQAVMTYTRAGNFSRNDLGYLVTGTGDYVIGKTQPYRAVIRAALKGAGQGHLMVVGIQPRWPETGTCERRADQRGDRRHDGVVARGTVQRGETPCRR